MTTGIKSEIKLVTPEMAREFLIFNEGNRRVRPSSVDYLSGIIKSNGWIVTHQGIAFSEEGRLLDGQHRLLAIIKADCPVLMMVSYGVSDSAYEAIDNGIKRTDEDLTKLGKSLVEVANLFIDVVSFESAEIPIRRLGSKKSPAKIKAYATVISDSCDLMLIKCNTTAKLWSSVPSRCAVIASIMLGEDKDYVLNLYRTMVLSDIEKMPPIARSALRQSLNGTLTTKGGSDTRIENFVKFMTMYKEKNKDTMKLLLRDKNESLRSIRAKLAPLFANAITPVAKDKKDKQELKIAGVRHDNHHIAA